MNVNESEQNELIYLSTLFRNALNKIPYCAMFFNDCEIDGVSFLEKEKYTILKTNKNNYEILVPDIGVVLLSKDLEQIKYSLGNSIQLGGL